MSIFKYKIKIAISKTIFPAIINLYIKTLSIKFYNKTENLSNKIFVFWHSKMFIGWWIFRNKYFLALVSQSNDGELLSNILKKWEYELIRGSSSKGGKAAIKQIINKPLNDKSIVITPDGPKGPAKEFKNGSLFISNKKNYPIIPVKISYSKKFILKKSWDKFEIPMPFTKCEVIFGDTFYYDNYLYDEELIKFKEKICHQL